MTALNLGWTGQSLAPHASRDFVFAVGLAATGAPNELPRLPDIRDEHWSRWRRLSEPKAGVVRDNAEFVAELVEFDVSRDALQVHGIYSVHNPTTASAAFTIGFPINVTPKRPAPDSVLVDGKPVEVTVESPQRVSASFSISVPAQSIRSFDVLYTQPHYERHAEYVVTSALTWKRPLQRAVFRIRAAAELGSLHTSYAARSQRDAAGNQILTIVRQPFVPDRELTMSW